MRNVQVSVALRNSSLLFADDVVVLTCWVEDLVEHTVERFAVELKISTSKSEVMALWSCRGVAGTCTKPLEVKKELSHQAKLSIYRPSHTFMGSGQ